MRNALLLVSLVATLAGCVATPRWETIRRPNAIDAARMMATDTLGLIRDVQADEVPLVPVRKRLRPCCAFGSGLRVRVGYVNIPGIAIDNIRSADNIGRHAYDAGQRGQDITEGDEQNGLVYTCRGGFIDTAHVRDYADWTLYLGTEIARSLETGGEIVLPDPEGGMRRFLLEPVDPELISIVGRRQLSASLAVWAGYQLSLWHEIATWYGWASFSLFSERASAFSPEDLYSNMLGAKISGPIMSSGYAVSEALFNSSVDGWFAQTLQLLGAVPAELGEAAMAAVDGVWWDSRARLPDASLVRRRSIQLDTRLEPWLVPEERLGPELSERLRLHCGEDIEPQALRYPSRIPGLDFASILTLEIELDTTRRALPELRRFDGIVRQSDFPALLEQIREEARDEFGPLADSPALE